MLAYLREQRDALVAQDPAVRRGLPDSVHQMRVATRRLRSAFKTYRRVLDPADTDPIGEELRWLSAELGVDRDQEVLLERIQTRLDELPRTLLMGPVRGRLRSGTPPAAPGRAAGAGRPRQSPLPLPAGRPRRPAGRPPLLKGAAGPPGACPGRSSGTTTASRAGSRRALPGPGGEERDLALHDARKAAKRVRYAAEAAVPALGKPAKAWPGAMKAVQTLLGDHQDSVVARDALRGLAVQAARPGESAFTWGAALRPARSRGRPGAASASCRRSSAEGHRGPSGTALLRGANVRPGASAHRSP